MILTIVEVLVLFGIIIIPLRSQKPKIKRKCLSKANTDNKLARYRVNAEGELEEFGN